MWSRLKIWLVAAGSVLLTIVTLGGWALLERKTRKYHERRAERAEKAADIHRTLARVAEASEKEKQAVDDVTLKALAAIQLARDTADEKREELRSAIREDQTPFVIWSNRRFGKKNDDVWQSYLRHALPAGVVRVRLPSIFLPERGRYSYLYWYPGTGTSAQLNERRD